MKRTHDLLALLAALATAAGLGAPAAAATLGFAPSSTSASLGDTFALDVVVSGLGGEIVSAYDLDIVFDDAVLAPTGVAFSAALGDPLALEAFVDFTTGPGLVDVAGVSLLPDADLLALQGGDGVTLFSVGFEKTGEGATGLAFVLDATNDVKGLGARILPIDAAAGSVRPPGEVVPEPTAALTFAAGLLVAGLALRRPRRG